MKRHKASDKKRIAIDLEIEEQLKVIKWPTVLDILPIALVRGTISFIMGIPAMFLALRDMLTSSIEKVKKEREDRKSNLPTFFILNAFSLFVYLF